jgi:hypothetical protein
LQKQDGKILDESNDDDCKEEGAEEEEEEEETPDGAKGEADMTYWRVRGLISSLLDSGRQALEVKPKDLLPAEGSKAAAKVLSAEEVRNWQRDSEVVMESDSLLSGGLYVASEGTLSAFGGDDTEAGDMSIADSADIDGDLSEEDEVETSSALKGLDRQNSVRSRRQSPTPPIVISGH